MVVRPAAANARMRASDAARLGRAPACNFRQFSKGKKRSGTQKSAFETKRKTKNHVSLNLPCLKALWTMGVRPAAAKARMRASDAARLGRAPACDFRSIVIR